MRIETKVKVNVHEWDAPLLNNTASSVYQSYYWAKLYQDVFDSKPLFLYAKNNSGKIIGQLLAFIHTKYYWINANPIFQKVASKLNLGSIISWHYGPVIHEESLTRQINEELIDALDKIALENDIIFIKGTSHPLSVSSDQHLLKKNEYEQKLWGTYVIDLNEGFEGLYNKLDKKTRYDIRKAEQNQIEFGIANNKSDLDEYIELKHREREKSGQKTTRIPFYNEKYWDYLYKNDHLLLFVARHKGDMIGGILGIVFNGYIIQHGVLTRKKELSGGAFLTWNSLKWASENNYKIFDMGGFNPEPDSKKEKSIDFFKSKWGGKELKYSLYTKISNKKKFNISTALIHPDRLGKKFQSFLRNSVI